jgi:glycopeptide antibiotics resistance protein
VFQGPLFSVLGIPLVIAFAAIRMARGAARKPVLVESLLVVWVLIAVDMLFFPVLVQAAVRESRLEYGVGMSFAPLHTVFELIGRESPFQAVRQIGGNLGVLLPVGLLAPALWTSLRDWRRMVVVAVCLGVGVEATQFALDLTHWWDRVVDIDDAMLNAVGVMLGFALWAAMSSHKEALPGRAPVEQGHPVGRRSLH